MYKYFFLSFLFLNSCVIPADKTNTENIIRKPEVGGGINFKIPLPPGFDWEVTQSWADHCELCNEKGYNKIFNGFFGDYCELSHSNSCRSKCKYGWDFNLPGNSDEGKSVLASANGIIKTILYNHGSWGNTVIIDHGNNICTRSAHLLDQSIIVNANDKICQGMKIAEIGGTPNFSPHLHFQFETCDTQSPLEMGFSDGNEIPVCTMGEDIYNDNGDYDFLILNNQIINSCNDVSECEQLSNCPMNKFCNRDFNHEFNDKHQLNSSLYEASKYLWYECAVDSDENNNFNKYSKVTKAQALKSVINAFGLYEACEISVDFDDVSLDDWYFPYVACALKNQMINSISSYFYPDKEISSAEAVRLIVLAAYRANLVNIVQDQNMYFHNIPKNHWSYKYFETIEFYGNLSFPLDNLAIDEEINKKEFVLMLASLSPCFCNNLSGEYRLNCDQENFTCY